MHAAANTTKLLCIGISASTKRAAANIRPVVDALRAAHYDGPVLVGGHAITSKAAARRRGGDEWASNSDAFVDLLQSLHAAK